MERCQSKLHWFIRPRERSPHAQGSGAGSENYLRLRSHAGLKLHTVCEEARCPNVGECWHHGTATFMILGDVCTRACAYCAVAHGRPGELDVAEPARVAHAIDTMGLRHAVITSVDRDDLADGGASMFVETIRQTRARIPECRIEVLIPDFQGTEAALQAVLDAGPDVLNHNIETVPRLYRMARSAAGTLARWSCSLGRAATSLNPDQDRIMVGWRELRQIVSVSTISGASASRS